jgi:predicted dehydrogenase
VQLTTVGFGVVGINPRIRRAILAGFTGARRARLAAVCSRDRTKAEQVAAELGCAAYDSYPDLLQDPAVDVVFICAPDHLHHALSLQALSAGKRVICEKPLAVTMADAEDMVKAAEATDRPALINFTYHSLSGHRFLARLLAEGALGELRHLDLSYWQARQGLPGARTADALFDVGSHAVDLALWWCDVGRAGNLRHVTGQDEGRGGLSNIVTAFGRTDHGAQVAIQLDRVAAGWRNGMVCRLVGEKGTLGLTFDTDQVEVTLAQFGEGSPEGLARQLTIPDDLRVSYRDFPAFHLDRLAAAVQGDGDFPDFGHGLRVQQVLAALRTAIDERRWVEIGS